jgi:hypothetical protein
VEYIRETSDVVSAFFRNIFLSERFQVRVTIINFTNPYDFEQLPKYSVFASCRYSSYDIFATYVKRLQDV